MNHSDLLNDRSFWKTLEILLQKKKQKFSVKSLESDLDLTGEEVRGLVNFLVNLGVGVRVDGENFEVQELPVFQWEVNLLDWIAFQAHFPFLSEHQRAPYNEVLKRFLSDKEILLQNHDFFEAFKTLEHSLESTSLSFLKEVEEGLLQKKVLRLQVQDRPSNIHCYPYRITYVDNELCLVSEDTLDRTLLALQLKKIEDVKLSSESYRPHFSPIDIAHFITSLREFGDSEEHLILKILLPREGVNLSPDYHYFRNASLLRSSRGDYIWSAYVEPGEKLFEWLEVLKKQCQFEILAPTNILEEFEDYMEPEKKAA